MKLASDRGVLKGHLQVLHIHVLHIHVLLVAPLGTGHMAQSGTDQHRVVVYNVGMNYIRSDPYAGMAALYYYLYCEDRTAQILLFPNISLAEWNELGRNTKTYRMFKEFGDAILFQDRLLLRDEL